MALWFDFISTHAMPCLGLVAALSFYLWDHPLRAYGIPKIDAHGMSQLINKNQATCMILDIRSEQDRVKQGQMHGNICYDIDEICSKKQISCIIVMGKQYEQRIEQSAIDMKKKMPSVDVYVLDGGIDQWIASGFPLVTVSN